MLELQRYDNIRIFKEDVILFLEQFEGENNLPLGVLMNVKEDEQPNYMATVTKNGQLCLTLLQTKPEQLILSKSLLLSDNEKIELAKMIHENYRDIPGLIGETSLVKALARKISDLSGREAKIRMEQRVYVLKNIKKRASDNGVLRIPDRRDFPLIENWVYNFSIEVGFPFTSKAEAIDKMHEMINEGRLYVWEVGGEPVSMASWARPTKSNVTIGYVYTPPEERKRGYASDCVSALTESLLKSGYQTASLYTDLANPTSNKIYMEIGYEPVMDSTLIHFI